MKNLNKHGFTLIELLVVIAIISLLSSVVMASLQGAKTKAMNTRINGQILEYAKAFELYKNQADSYPTAGTLVRPFCLGLGYTRDQCGKSGAGVKDDNLNSQLDDFIPGLPKVGDRSITIDGGDSWVGATYQKPSGLSASVTWYLEGDGQNCARPQNSLGVTPTDVEDGSGNVIAVRCVWQLP